MADTRRDKRAPVALKVRYKSATVDEFLEHYSEDISRGGTFIKSKQPMAVGTLLKFELQLQDQSRLIHGVGRVVWKREEAEASEGKPPGMGVKFIKMDAESRGLVQKILETRGDEPGRFDAQADAQGGDGSNGSAGSGAFFPSSTPEEDLPAPEDRTAVRHASEFLAEALADTDEAAATEARAGAEEARKRTEELERERAQSLPPEQDPQATSQEPAPASQEDIGAADTLLARPEDLPQGPASSHAPGSPSGPAEEGAEEAPSDGEAPSGGEAELEGATTLPRRPVVEPAASQPATSPEGAQTSPASKESRSRVLPMAVALVAVGLVAYLVVSNTGMLGGAEAPDEAAAAAVEEVDLVDAPPAMEDPQDDPVAATAEQAEDEPEPEAVAETPEVIVPVRVKGAADAPITWLVDDVEVGQDLEEIALPVGEEVTVRVATPGYTAEPQAVAAAEDGQEPLVFELTEMPYMLMVETEPPGVRVRAGGGRVTTPGRLRLRRVSDPVTLTAERTGFRPLREQMPLSEFQANHEEGEMQATIELTLERAAAAGEAAAAGQAAPSPTQGEADEEPEEAAAEAEAKASPEAAEEPKAPEPEPEPESEEPAAAPAEAPAASES